VNHNPFPPSPLRPGRPGLSFCWAIFLTAAVLAAAGCSRGRLYLVNSLGAPHAITVDGETGDWFGALSHIAKAQVFVGFVNDRETLYICLTREAAGEGPSVPMGGLTVWIDPAGGDAKKLGLRIATAGGPLDGRPMGGRPKPGDRPEREPETEDKGQDAEGRQPPKTPELEILDADGAVVRKLSLEAADKEGLQARTGMSNGAFVLELAIPLRPSEGRPVAVGAGPGDLVGVGFFSSRAGQTGMRGGPPGGGMPGGIGGGAGGSQPGGIGGGMGMGGPQRPNMEPDLAKSIRIWTRVRLNREPGARPAGAAHDAYTLRVGS
jgi:hypothetical protein